MKRKSKKKDFGKMIITVLVLFAVFMYNEFILENDNKSLDEDTSDVLESDESSVQLKVDGNFNVYYFNVGQADSILIENNGSYMLIDAGNNADGKKLVNYFNDMGIEKFDYVIATHAHEDHIGGMDNIINNFEVDKFYMPDVVTTSKTFEDVIIALEDNKVGLTTPNIGDTFTFGGCYFTVLYLSDDDSDLNDTSIVVRGVYGDTSFLFMGDATGNAEATMLNKTIDSDVLKVGHHGSRYSSTLDFLNKVTPEYAIVSVGVGNSYEHPHDEALTRLENIGAKVYRTDNDGTILVTSDGENISVQTLDVNLNG